MKVEQLLQHHGIAENPFSQEDASNDQVFKQYCLNGTHHPAWDKIYNDPEHPATSVVFGEKGSGKTALRLQIIERLKQYNREHADRQVFSINYDDLNPFLDCFRERLSGRKRRPERALANWRLWDHMDAILSLGVSNLAELVLDVSQDDPQQGMITSKQVRQLTRQQKRDLLLLAAFYDHTLDMPPKERWKRLKRRLRFPTWKSEWDRILGVVVTAMTVGMLINVPTMRSLFFGWISAAFIVAGWMPWLLRQARLYAYAWRVARQIRVIDHQPNTLRQILARFVPKELAGQPMPSKDRSDDRYELLYKFQAILEQLSFASIVVLVDRVDEPHLVNGSPERIRDFLWSMFDNKFLKHPGIGFKLLLPSDVVYYLDREGKEFYERSRLDKQNLIKSLDWTGESLYDVANDRLKACAPERGATVRDLFDPSISEDELISIFVRLRVPRHLFKFFYRLLVDHCSRFTEDNPSWTINRETLQSTLALYMRDLEALDRGAGTG